MPSPIHLKNVLLVAALLVVSLLTGCVATTTATVQSTFHAADTYRFQSCDLTAMVQVELKQN